MSEPFVGEIRMFAGTFAPMGWAFCDGQLLAISQNDALFSLLGTTYGGDGRTTFGLPDLRGRFPMHQGSGHPMGQKSGEEKVSLTTGQLPSHAHTLRCNAGRADATTPVNNALAASASGDRQYAGQFSTTAEMHTSAVASIGGSQAHNNVPPFLGVNFIIALFGIYPSRS